MKYRKLILIYVLISVFLLAAVNVILIMFVSESRSSRSVSANRINSMICRYLAENEISASQTEQIVNAADKVFAKKEEYGLKSQLPYRMEFVSVSSVDNVSDIYDSDTVICAVYDRNEELAGFIIYRFKNRMSAVLMTANAALVMLSAISFYYFFYIEKNIIKPFNTLSGYPEKLSLGYTGTELPESKSRYFGKYIWGMNMLRDRLVSDRRVISRLEHDRQTLISSIAHGVKTPVTNILLYSEAISTGLYSGGKTHPEDVSTAEKITENAYTIRNLTEELLETASNTVYEEKYDIKEFYCSELTEMIKNEYSRKMELMMVPFEVICENDPIVKSDINVLMQIIIQITENALKYGNGEGIRIEIEKQDDTICMSVRNKGDLLPEKEMPFIFNSFWRGSNSSAAEGNGIGLYVSRKAARGLGGDLYAQRHEDTGEMEFLVIIDA